MTKSRGMSRIMPRVCFNTKSYFNDLAKRRPTLRTLRTSGDQRGKREKSNGRRKISEEQVWEQQVLRD